MKPHAPDRVSVPAARRHPWLGHDAGVRPARRPQRQSGGCGELFRRCEDQKGPRTADFWAPWVLVQCNPHRGPQAHFTQSPEIPRTLRGGGQCCSKDWGQLCTRHSAAGHTGKSVPWFPHLQMGTRELPSQAAVRAQIRPLGSPEDRASTQRYTQQTHTAGAHHGQGASACKALLGWG